MSVIGHVCRVEVGPEDDARLLHRHSPHLLIPSKDAKSASSGIDTHVEHGSALEPWRCLHRTLNVIPLTCWPHSQPLSWRLLHKRLKSWCPLRSHATRHQRQRHLRVLDHDFWLDPQSSRNCRRLLLANQTFGPPPKQQLPKLQLMSKKIEVECLHDGSFNGRLEFAGVHRLRHTQAET